jgi:poly(3-hydroxybutyrate) depolymerase
VLVVHGLLDDEVSASSVVDAAKAWARQDQCQPEPVSETLGWNIEYDVFRGCEAAADVQLYLLTDTGHEWPERVEDLTAAKRWSDLMSTTTVALTFCETYAR